MQSWDSQMIDGVFPPSATRVSLPPVAPQQTVATARDAFMNAIRILYSMEPGLPCGAYDRFIESPCEFLMTADEPTLQKIWDAVQARQPARYRR